MINIKRFTFNPFQVNTFILYDNTKECVIIDPGCEEEFECYNLLDFIENKELKPVKLLCTHTHIDHIMGSNLIEERLGIGLGLHEAGKLFLEHAVSTAAEYGISLSKAPKASHFISDGEIITFGNSKLEVLYTPGHADGSVCFLCREQNFVIVGDVLFNMGIGRTDFPTGDFDLLQKSIFEKLFVLPDETVVYTGHGPETSIGYEKNNNPFLTRNGIMH
jgi:glyoxylase-like metal-dependent hydrolase (beta-lactamase superfamily II)